MRGRQLLSWLNYLTSFCYILKILIMFRSMHFDC